MTKQFIITVVPETLIKSARGTITGKICIKIGNHTFPEVEWNDFVVTILYGWSDSIIGLYSGMASSTDCQFMDGPFHFNIEAESQSRWQVQGKMRRRDSDEFLFTYFITPQLMVSELLATSVLVLEICKEKGWDSTEIQNLNDACANLSYFHKGKSVEK